MLCFSHLETNESSAVSPMIKQWKCWEVVTGKTEFVARKTLEVRNIKEYSRPSAHCWAWNIAQNVFFSLYTYNVNAL